MNRPTDLQPADLGTILFAAAVAQGRADALKAAAKKAAHDLANQQMLESFRKTHEYYKQQEQAPFADERTQAEIDAEMLACFDGGEAQWINSGRY